MDINPPWSRGGAASADVVTFLCRSDGAAVSVGPLPGGPPGSGAVLVGLGVRLPGASPARLRLTPDEAGRLAGLLTDVVEGGASAAPDHVPDGAWPEPAAGARSDAVAGSRYVVVAPEGAAVTELWPALAAVPPGARLVDFSSDADVVLVFALDDPRWPVRPVEADSASDREETPGR
ncbi:hypothetical protein [Frankia sp. R82]|uniref:hypothetical protein n=1 Tax=Frankia sp. R82 TaxID=2950553 RepID=UPI002043C9FE|nr:hypothetical protein [Frankia sp. R82]MCM3885466.1 hypothetical protein [Frankia sp. R82]